MNIWGNSQEQLGYESVKALEVCTLEEIESMLEPEIEEAAVEEET